MNSWFRYSLFSARSSNAFKRDINSVLRYEEIRIILDILSSYLERYLISIYFNKKTLNFAEN